MIKSLLVTLVLFVFLFLEKRTESVENTLEKCKKRAENGVEKCMTLPVRPVLTGRVCKLSLLRKRFLSVET